MDGLALRPRTIANNIANDNTPTYQAKRVSFEAALAASVKSGDGHAAAATTSASLEPTGLNGNNVNLDSETIIATETGLRYQLARNALDGKYNTLRTALRTS